MRDIREMDSLPEHWLWTGQSWRDASFVWKRWDLYSEDWSHSHCEFCFACICNHRDRFPEVNPEERGCYRHAYYAEKESLSDPDSVIYIWVCRSCFKRLHAEFGWTAGESQQSLTSGVERPASTTGLADHLVSPGTQSFLPDAPLPNTH